MAQIRAGGPISVADYMAECLLHPKHGYYTTRQPFGRGGDFVTAPEISQMFGELLGLCLAQAWMDQGGAQRFVLAELGPGNATLMADVLRATKQVPGFLDGAEIWLVEASPALRDQQKSTLDGYAINWAARIEDLPQGPLFLLANEFFDALPVRQFSRHVDGWQEIMVTENGSGLAFALADPSLVHGLEDRLADTSPGDIVEYCGSAGAVMGDLAHRIARHGGAAIVVDYGNWGSLGDSLQAVKDHRYDHPLAHPGRADITAHVDFAELARHAPGVLATPMTGQGDLLQKLGIASRHAVLAQKLTGEALRQHDAALKRLTAPGEMGQLFKAIGFHPKGTPPPPGFDT